MKEAGQAKDGSAALRWAVYGLLITLAAGSSIGRILCVWNGSDKNPSPFLSANDRSRWCTIRSLVDEGTYAIDNVAFDAKGDRIRGWHTIDLVRHRSSDGMEHYYSSKPTLLPTLLAGEYWLIKTVTGATLKKQTFYVARLMLILTNVLPFVVALIILARLVERYGTTDYGRIFVMACATGGTFLTTFAITLNNHLIAAVSAIFALAVVLPICVEGRKEWRYFLLAGLWAAFTAANELPALAFFVMAGLVLAWKSPLRATAGFLPPALLVVLAAVGTNYLAHGTWKPAYAHRSDGPVVAEIPIAMERFAGAKSQILHPDALASLRDKGIELSPATTVTESHPNERWIIFDPETERRYAVTYPDFRPGWGESGTAPRDPYFEVRAWGNWYEFEGSYWSSGELSGVDKGEPSVLVYAFHCLVGHHGLFSLTPIWLLSVVGIGIWLRSTNRSLAAFALLTALLTIIVLGFYLSRPQIDRNYGGVSCCLRWLLWLAPLWLLLMLPAADWLAARRWGWWLTLSLLAVSVLSANYAAMNPWSHPWLFDYWTYLRWIEY